MKNRGSTGKIARHQMLSSGYVVPDPSRCVQCGVCSFNCPIGIDIRYHAWVGASIKDSRCLTCGECVNRCPRGVLRFEKTNIFDFKAMTGAGL